MDVNTDDLSAFLNRAWENAKNEANTLPGQLLIEQQAAINYIATGSLSTVGKNSTSQSYGGYNPGNLTHRQITEIFTILIRKEKECRNHIIACAERDDVTIPADFDLDPAVKDLIERALGVGSEATRIPDIRDLRIPLCRPACTTTEVCA